MTDSPLTERSALQRQYADGRSLDARSSIYAWQEPRFDLVELVVERVPTTADRVLDVGCGRGNYLAALASRGHEAIGLDLSPGLARASAEASLGATAVADASVLPFADGTFDAALAMHMLYHLPEPAAGLRELRRVTRDGGTVLILTNGHGHLAEHRRLLGEAAGFDRALVSTDAQFAVEDRPLVESVFGPVELVELHGLITLDHPEPIVRYAASAEEFYGPQVPMPWPEFLDEFAVRATERIARDGTIQVHTHSGLFIATV